MRVGDGRLFVRSEFFSAESRNPHVPIALKMELNVFHFQSGGFPVFGHHATGCYHVLDEIVGDLNFVQGMNE